MTTPAPPKPRPVPTPTSQPFWDALRDVLLPRVVEGAMARVERTLCAWSLGCASGEEPYTLAILWHVELAPRFPTIDLALVATDRENTKIVSGIFFESRRYIEQRGAGSFEGQRGGATWTFEWRAPKRDKGPLTIYVAGNVGNGNGDKTGDFVFYLERTALPAT